MGDKNICYFLISGVALEDNEDQLFSISDVWRYCSFLTTVLIGNYGAGRDHHSSQLL